MRGLDLLGSTSYIGASPVAKALNPLLASGSAWIAQAQAVAPPSTTTTAGAPTISSIADSLTGAQGAGSPGDTVIITGQNFAGVTSVDFNGAAAQFSVDSPTQITAVVPMNASTGSVHVTNSSGTGTSGFSVAPSSQQPPPNYDTGGGGGGFGGGGGGGFDSGGGGSDDGSGDGTDDGSGDGGDGSADGGYDDGSDAAYSDGGDATPGAGGFGFGGYGMNFSQQFPDANADAGSDAGSDDGSADDGGDSTMLGLDVFTAQRNPLFERVYRVSTAAKDLVLGTRVGDDIVAGNIDVAALQQRLDSLPQTNRTVWTLWSEPEPGFPNGHGMALTQRAAASAQRILDKAILPTNEFQVHDALTAFSKRAFALGDKITKQPYDDNTSSIWNEVRSYFIDGSNLVNTIEGVENQSVKWSDVKDTTTKLAKGAADTAKMMWWTIAALVAGGVAVVGLIAWKLVSSGTVRDVGTAYVRR